VWLLGTNVLEDHAASIFRVEVRGEWKVDTCRQGMRRGKDMVSYSVSQYKALEESL